MTCRRKTVVAAVSAAVLLAFPAAKLGSPATTTTTCCRSARSLGTSTRRRTEDHKWQRGINCASCGIEYHFLSPATILRGHISVSQQPSGLSKLWFKGSSDEKAHHPHHIHNTYTHIRRSTAHQMLHVVVRTPGLQTATPPPPSPLASLPHHIHNTYTAH